MTATQWLMRWRRLRVAALGYLFMGAGFALTVTLIITRGNRLAGFPLALADAAAAVLAIAEVGHVELRQRDGNEILSLPADHRAVRHIFPQVLSYLPANDLFEPRRVAVNLHHHWQFRVRRECIKN